MAKVGVRSLPTGGPLPGVPVRYVPVFGESGGIAGALRIARE